MCVSEVIDAGGQRCEEYEVVALGSGQNCCSGWLSYTGCVIHDCHAIVIARRALKRCKKILYRHISILKSIEEERQRFNLNCFILMLLLVCAQYICRCGWFLFLGYLQVKLLM